MKLELQWDNVVCYHFNGEGNNKTCLEETCVGVMTAATSGRIRG